MRKVEKIPWVKLTLCIGLGIVSVAASFMYQPSSELITITTECDPCQKISLAEKVVVVPLLSRLPPKPPPVCESESTLLYQALIWFNEGEAQLDPDALQVKQTLQYLSDIVEQHPDAVILLGGHTDQRGSAKVNQELSKKRAESVKAFLTKRLSVDADRIHIQAHGSSQLMQDQSTCSAYARNRRVELRVMSGKN